MAARPLRGGLYPDPRRGGVSRDVRPAPGLSGRSRAGLAGGNPWLCEYGVDLSRGFRALKVWFTLQTFGLDRLGEAIARNCAQARYMGERVTAERELELLAPVLLNIVCFRYGAAPAEELDRLNAAIAVELQVRGLAAPSTTRIGGRRAIRARLCNHRTEQWDLSALIDGVLELGRLLRSRGSLEPFHADRG